MALVTTMSGVIGVLAAMALLLWFSAYIESRHLGPVMVADEQGSSADVVAIEEATVAAENLSPAA